MSDADLNVDPAALSAGSKQLTGVGDRLGQVLADFSRRLDAIDLGNEAEGDKLVDEFNKNYHPGQLLKAAATVKRNIATLGEGVGGAAHEYAQAEQDAVKKAES
ncbi:MAG: hypothetical protein JWN95_417 [Frankiales bacterium]|nr:hypothetical protein [Frankiales bacterium]